MTIEITDTEREEEDCLLLLRTKVSNNMKEITVVQTLTSHSDNRHRDCHTTSSSVYKECRK